MQEGEGRRTSTYLVTTELPREREFLIELNQPLDAVPHQPGGSVQRGFLEQLRLAINAPLADALEGRTVALSVKEIDPRSGRRAGSSVGRLRLAIGSSEGAILIVPYPEGAASPP